ncbi:transcriptional regulator [Lachnospiraceae bacterium JC7]|nr:transcriptional regulator [Lachnospiraceae bacterium JC7]
MDTQSIRYFIALAQNLQFTKTAQQFYTSQQNLSQHISKLENFYGTPLFYRKPKLSLTPAGEVLYESFVKIVNEADNVKLQINDVLQNNIGSMTIGASPYRGQFWIPRVLPAFMKKWPNVSLKIKMQNSSLMEKEIINGDMDFFIGIRTSDESVLKVIPLMKDRVYLVVTRNLLNKFFGDNTESIIRQCEFGTTLEPFRDFPFLRLTDEFRLRKKVDACFAASDITPHNVLEIENIETMIKLIPADIGAFFCTGLRIPFLKNVYPNACFFPLMIKDEFIYSSMSIVYHKNHYFPQYSQDFINELKNFFNQFSMDET